MVHALRYAAMLMTLMLASFSILPLAHALKAREPIAADPPGLAIIPIDMDPWVRDFYPRTNLRLPALKSEYPQDILTRAGLESFTFSINDSQIDLYRIARDHLLEDIKARPVVDPKLYFLLGDIELTLGFIGDLPMLAEARLHYERGLALEPKTDIAANAWYNLAMSMMESGESLDAIKILRIQEQRFSNRPEWLRHARQLLMEAYFRKGRFERAEDYLWMIAKETTERSVESGMILRYGDALYGRGEFQLAADWYRKYPELLDVPKADAMARTSAIHYAESLFQLGQFQEARTIFAALMERPDDLQQYFEYRLAECDSMIDGKIIDARTRYQDLARRYLSFPVGQASRVALLRLDALEYGSATGPVSTVVKNMKDMQLLPPIRRSADEVAAWIAYKQGKFDDVLAVLDRYGGNRGKSRSDLWTNDMTVAALVALLPAALKEKRALEYLQLCNRYAERIRSSHAMDRAIYAIAQAYIAARMDVVAERVLTRLLDRFELSPEMADRVNIVLAGLALEGDDAAAAEAMLARIKQPERHQQDVDYLAARAKLQYLNKDYERSIETIKAMTALPLDGTERLEADLLMAKNLRALGKYEEALNLVMAIVGPLESYPQQAMEELQNAALAEAMAISVTEGNFAKAVVLFERVQEPFLKAQPPMDAILMIVSAYDALGKHDEAQALWLQVAKNDERVEKELAQGYDAYLKTKRQTELIR